jgi:hypothetical protein
LFDPARPTNTWRLRDSVDFNFPPNTTIPPGGFLLVVSFDPVADTAALNAFRATYGLSESVSILGPYGDRLANSSDSVELYKPDEPQPNGSVPYVLADKVRYTDTAPWPTAADSGTNSVSLQRRVAAEYGNDPVNWLAGNPTPGAATSHPVATLPAIAVQPASQSAPPGASVTFSVTAVGAAPLVYQWRLNGQDIAGATGPSLTLNNVQAAQAGRYTVRVSNRAGAALSAAATLTLQLPPIITQQPQNRIVAQGGTAQFGVAARGTLPLSYQWRFGGTDLPGQTSQTLVVSNVQPANVGNYSVVITNTYGSLTSMVATLIIHQPPSITDQPDNVTVFAGSTVTLSVSAQGSPPLGYQWRYNGINISGANNATLTLPNAQPGQSGQYTVRVTNLVGSVLSDVAVVTVVVPPVVSVTASDPIAAEPGPDTGEFTLSRTGSTALPLTVNFAVGGTATSGADFSPIASPVTIPAGAASTTVQVAPLNDPNRETIETVVLVVTNGADYVVGSPANATVFLFDDDNARPSVAIVSPAEGTLYPITPTNVAVTVSTSDTDGSVVKVEFFSDGLRLGESTTPPFDFVWSDPPPGTNLLRAVATDDLGATNTSAPRAIVVNFPPEVAIVSPGGGATFGPGANIAITATASDLDGTVTNVEFYAGTTLLGADAESPFSATFNGAPVGLHALTAAATDDRGMTRTSEVTTVVVKVPSSTFKDMFFERGDINGVTNYVQSSNTNATRELDEPPPFSSGTRTVWITWTAPASGSCTMDTFGSTFDTVLAVFTNHPPNVQSVSNLVLVAQNDDFDGLQSQVTFQAVVGQAYHVSVDGFSSTSSGTIQFHLFLNTPFPTILAQPQSRTVVEGGNASFSVTAAGAPPLRYQWRFNGNELPGATTNLLSITGVQPVHLGEYRVVVANALGAATSAVATLAFGVPAAIAVPPVGPTVTEGDNATFTVTTTGTLPITYEWRLSSTPLTNLVVHAHTNTFTLYNVQTNQNGTRYRVVISNPANAQPVGSPLVTLTVLADADRDRIPDFWEAMHGFDPNSPDDAEPDSDGDSMSNRAEYIAGTNPTNALSYLKVDHLSSASGAATLRFLAVSNRTYTVLYCDALQASAWLRLSNVLARTTNRVEVITDPNAGNGRRFYRLVTPVQP